MIFGIENKDDFIQFGDFVNRGILGEKDVVKLLCDLDLNPGIDVKKEKRGERFHISNLCVSASGVFHSIFDGCGHTISGVFGNALFCTNRGTIKNVTVDGYIHYSPAGIVAYANQGRVLNCINKATIVSDHRIPSGIVGRNSYLGSIENCINYGDLKLTKLEYMPTLTECCRKAPCFRCGDIRQR